MARAKEPATAAIPGYPTPEVTRQSREPDSTYYQIFLTGPDLAIIIDPADNTFIEANDAFVKHTGYPRKELIGRHIMGTNLFAYTEEFQKMSRIFKEQGMVTNEELSLRTKSGEIRQWTCSVKIININGTDRLVAVATDNTERKRMEEA